MSELLNSNSMNTEKIFWFFLTSLTFFRLIYIFFIPVTPQEAYYWYYSQYPAWSYFDHPPMAAYSIWVGTQLFGNSIFGVKFVGLFWSALTNILIFYTTRKMIVYNQSGFENKATASLPLIAVLLYNLTTFAHIYAVSTMPDTPLLFFWMLVLFTVQEALQTQKKSWWFAAGAALGFGLMSKYTMIAIVPSVFLYLLIEKEHRAQLLKPWPYLAILIAAVIFSPVIFWNQQHEWASFIFQFGERAEAMKPIRFKYFGQLVGSQMFILTPFVFVLFLVVTWKIISQWKSKTKFHFFFLSAMIITGGFILISLRSLVKMNWLLPGYLGLIMISASLCHSEFKCTSRWLRSGAIVSIILITAAHLIWLIPNIPLGEGNTWSGWQDAAKQVFEIQKELGGKDKVFIFSNSYKGASLMKFYLPDQQDVYAQNVYKEPALQFDFWPLPDSLEGKDALYIFSNRREYPNDLMKVRRYFDEVNLLKTFEYQFFGEKTRTIFCYLAKNYHSIQWIK